MTVYVDHDFKCHTENDGTMTAVETRFFDGKCQEFIEGYRITPEGWMRSDGEVFPEKMITPWKPYSELESAQIKYERQLLVEYTEALRVMGVVV